MKSLYLLAALLLLAGVTHAQAPPPPPDELRQHIARLDAEMFAAFNAHDIAKLMSYFAPDLEFYHDQGGRATCKRSKGSRR
jgi:hypothetical protein